MKIQINNRTFYGQKIKLVEIGKVTLDESGIVEVPDSVGALLISSKEWSEVSNGTQESEEDETEEVVDLDLMDRKQLKFFIKANELDVPVYRNDSDEALREKIRIAVEQVVEEEEEVEEEEDDSEGENETEEQKKSAGEWEDLEAAQKELSNKTVKELQKICESADFPEEDWKNLLKVKLVEYIANKYFE